MSQILPVKFSMSYKISFSQTFVDIMFINLCGSRKTIKKIVINIPYMAIMP